MGYKMTISIANGGWCQWDNQLGSFNGQAGSGYPLTNGSSYLHPGAAGVTLDQDQVLALLEERDTMQRILRAGQKADTRAF